MAHLDIARAIMEETGEENIKRVLAGIEMLSSALSKSVFLKSSPMTI